MAASQSMFVRLKPYNKKRGYTVQRYSVFGIRFDHNKGWYRVDRNVAEYLKTVHCDNNNPDSPLAFDICTESEAREMAEAERKAALNRGEVQSPIDTAADTRLDTREAREAAAAHRGRAEQVGSMDPEGGGDMTTADLQRRDDDATNPSMETAVMAAEERKLSDMPQPPAASDDLTALDGIGEATESKLYEAGLTTYGAIAEADLATLQEHVGGKAKAVKKQAAKLAKG